LRLLGQLGEVTKDIMYVASRGQRGGGSVALGVLKHAQHYLLVYFNVNTLFTCMTFSGRG
jgi:hypothetical protein